jgi:3-oxoacyl-[acyl-carrier protein] reductase
MVSPGYLSYSGNAEDLAELVPLGRVGRVDEIASLVVSLCSQAGDYVTGQTIHANGGVWS